MVSHVVGMWSVKRQVCEHVPCSAHAGAEDGENCCLAKGWSASLFRHSTAVLIVRMAGWPGWLARRLPEWMRQSMRVEGAVDLIRLPRALVWGGGGPQLH